MKEYFRKRDEAKSQVKSIPDFDDAINDDDYDLDNDDIVQLQSNTRFKKSSTHGSTSASVQSKKTRTIGPLDTYYTPEPKIGVVVENRKAKDRAKN
ncbi:hypothetical protein RHMOL_Rhmol07G0194300 [Rhododendron molle]|uniref:Uncharacterized protein n=1 Tax=Rhododendron molle TaxID=49168 RepID=A0ACC0N2E0_RHOML|nr:hypothetical protein RHMOL_Rhmol07G0194300 [Rhododendron molle]